MFQSTLYVGLDGHNETVFIAEIGGLHEGTHQHITVVDRTTVAMQVQTLWLTINWYHIPLRFELSELVLSLVSVEYNTDNVQVHALLTIYSKLLGVFSVILCVAEV